MDERDVTIPAIDEFFRKDDCYCQETVKQITPPKAPITSQVAKDDLEPLKKEIGEIIDDWAYLEQVPAQKTVDLKQHLNVVVYAWWKHRNTNS